MRTALYSALIALTLLTAAPVALADTPGDHPKDPADQATWGLCTADDASEDGDDASNGTVSSAPPFSNTSEEECDQASHPSNGTAAEDRVPDHPGRDDHPDDEDHPNGSDSRDDGNRSESRGSDEDPSDRGSRSEGEDGQSEEERSEERP